MKGENATELTSAECALITSTPPVDGEPAAAGEPDLVVEADGGTRVSHKRIVPSSEHEARVWGE